MSVESQPRSDPRAQAIPVARPAPPRAPAPDTEELQDEPVDELFTPQSLKGWATSFGLHAVLLICLAFWVFSPPRKEAQVLDTRIGDGGTGDLGEAGSMKGLGLDEPLVIEPPPLGVEQPLQTLTSAALIEPTNSLKAPNQAGIDIPNPGTGQGGSGEGFGRARFGNGTEDIGGIGVKVGDPQFTLIWDTGADVDLHVIEPGGSEIYWESPHGKKGGELDVDDIDGLGPENVFWVQGKGPPGVYKWYVRYYGGLGGRSVSTKWKVRVKHKGKVNVYSGRLPGIGAVSKTYTLTVEADDSEPVDKGQESDK